MARYLECPECGADAIPSSSYDRQHGWETWSEDDAAVCPGCGVALRANLVVDEDLGEWMEAVVVDEEHAASLLGARG